MTLYELSQLDVRDIDPAKLVNISSVDIDMDLPPAQRVEDMMRQMNGYPYHFISKNGDKGKPIIVKVTFPQTDVSCNDCLANHYRTI
jgi:hypothetical protein